MPHIALAEASGNIVFRLIIHSIVDLLQEARRLAIAASGSAARAMQEHMSQARQEIIATLQRRSGADQGAQHEHI